MQGGDCRSTQIILNSISSGVLNLISFFIVVLAAAQLVRPERANPPTDPNRTIQAARGNGERLGMVGIARRQHDRTCVGDDLRLERERHRAVRAH
jgi:hypothetical protein